MYFMYHCWNRTLQGKSKWISPIKLCQRQKNFRLEITKSMKSKQLLTVQYMANKQITKCQASITLFCGKTIQKKNTTGSLHWQSYTSEN